MKNSKIIILLVLFLITSIYVTSCKTSQSVASKSGAQIWGENCMRCHNTASPETFSDTEWDVATTHMQVRANLTLDEAEKVVAFLQSAN